MICMDDLRIAGEEYLAARHDPSDPDATACYANLAPIICHQFSLLTGDLGIKVDLVDDNPIDDASALFSSIWTGILPVWTGGQPPEDHPLTRILPGYGLTLNSMFRAVHDFFGHFLSGADFSYAGEILAYDTHLRTIRHPWARKALFTETIGQLGAHFITGTFPDQKACIIN